MGWAYLTRRIGWSVAAVWAAATITYLVAYGIPQNPAAIIAGPRATPALMAQIDRALGLNQPLLVRYGEFLLGLVHGSLGYSYIMHRPVASLVGEALPPTLLLTLAAVVMELLLGLGIGLASDRVRSGPLGAVLRLFTLASLSLPAYWVGVMSLSLIAFGLGWFPLGGYSLAGVVLPAFSVALPGSAFYARLLRSSLRQVWPADHVRTAQAKGAGEVRVLLRHVLRNALIPVATYFGLDVANLLSGLIVTEVVFSWPGLGMLTNQAIGNLDGAVIMGVTLVAATAVVAANLLIDVVYLWLDPRISYS